MFNFELLQGESYDHNSTPPVVRLSQVLIFMRSDLRQGCWNQTGTWYLVRCICDAKYFHPVS